MDGTVLVADDDRTIRTVSDTSTGPAQAARCTRHPAGRPLMRLGGGEGKRRCGHLGCGHLPRTATARDAPKIAQDRPGLPVIVDSRRRNTIMTATGSRGRGPMTIYPRLSILLT